MKRLPRCVVCGAPAVPGETCDASPHGAMGHVSAAVRRKRLPAWPVWAAEVRRLGRQPVRAAWKAMRAPGRALDPEDVAELAALRVVGHRVEALAVAAGVTTEDLAAAFAAVSAAAFRRPEMLAAIARRRAAWWRVLAEADARGETAAATAERAGWTKSAVYQRRAVLGMSTGKLRGVRHRSTAVTADQVRMVRRRHAAGEAKASIARRLGLSVSTVGRIARGETFLDVPPEAED